MTSPSSTTSANNRGVQRETFLVSEAGLYEVIFMSRKPEAKAFKRWVTSEVLPSIRKHGIPNLKGYAFSAYPFIPLSRHLD